MPHGTLFVPEIGEILTWCGWIYAGVAWCWFNVSLDGLDHGCVSETNTKKSELTCNSRGILNP
jgi:hypothetical protein